MFDALPARTLQEEGPAHRRREVLNLVFEHKSASAQSFYAMVLQGDCSRLTKPKPKQDH